MRWVSRSRSDCTPETDGSTCEADTERADITRGIDDVPISPTAIHGCLQVEGDRHLAVVGNRDGACANGVLWTRGNALARSVCRGYWDLQMRTQRTIFPPSSLELARTSMICSYLSLHLVFSLGRDSGSIGGRLRNTFYWKWIYTRALRCGGSRCWRALYRDASFRCLCLRMRGNT